MGEIAIHVENLSTRYCIGPRERYKALRDVLTDAFTSPFRRLGSSFQRPNVQTFHRSTLNSPFEIRNSQWPWSPVVSSQSSRSRPPHVSLFTFHGFIPHSTFCIPNLKGPRTLHLALLNF